MVWRVVLFLFSCAHAYPDGAPEEACASMVPQHEAGVQTDKSPFVFTVSSSTYSPGQDINVTITGTDEAYFKGFLIQPRLSSGSPGTAGELRGIGAMRSVCKPNAALTHTSNDIKTSINFVWIAPTKNMGNITFVYTIVHEKTTFWANLKADPIKYYRDDEVDNDDDSVDDDDDDKSSALRHQLDLICFILSLTLFILNSKCI